MIRSRTVLFVFAGLLASLAAAEGPAHANFAFESGGHRLTVWYHRPAAAPADAPVLFVIHGVGRNAEEYLADWIELAEQKKFLLVAPEFSKAEFPGEEAFNSGNLFDAAGRALPRAQWSYSMIEPMFDTVRARLGSARNDYLIYGHSAGAQFVQRFLYFVPQARVTRACAANAGWYMLPELSRDYPYGLKGTPADAAALRTAFARPVVILLGEADTDPNHAALRHTPEADAQGLCRFARGQYFFARAKTAADAMQAPFHWTLATAPGIAHSNKGMAPFAARQLFSE
ncbi:MAG: alpha/beta hydrolase [Opitutae bacterium]|nr:alpha/beta hydrolase [Opitutae bacterium]